MKKLISVKEVENAKNEGLNTIYIGENTIVTAAAKELAADFKIVISSDIKSSEICNESAEVLNKNGLDGEAIYNLFSKLMEKEIVKENVSEVTIKAFDADSASNGLKVVYGESVKMENFDTGNPEAKVAFQELVNKNESAMSAGFLTIDESKFDWQLTYEEVDYIIEGTVQITINGKVLTANKGDVIYVPSGSDVTWASPNKAKLFFVTYPANWADNL